MVQSQKTEYHYYITAHDISSTNSSDLSAGPRIFKVKLDYKWIITKSEGPFLSIRNLKRNSQIYKRLEITKGKRAQQITTDKNIIELRKDGSVYSPLSEALPMDFLRVIEHAVKGSVKNGKVSGVHFFDKEKVKIIQLLRANVNGVFDAIIEYYDSKEKLWVKKENSSTFFPESWSFSQLFNECKFACGNQRKILVDGKEQVFRSNTESGISVNIVYTISGELKTIYPIFD